MMNGQRAHCLGPRTFIIVVVLLLLSLSACGGTNVTTGEDYGDLFASPSGLTLTAEEHPDGWSRADCDVCHNLVNIHLGPDVGGFDMEAVRELVANEGLTVCPLCHGDNGVE